MKPNEYQCARCKEVFEKGWSDKESEAEAEQLFPGLLQAPSECRVVLCEDCFQILTAEQYQ